MVKKRIKRGFERGENKMNEIKLHCGKPVTLVSDFGSFFFMCDVCKAISNCFDSYKESPDLIELKRIQFRKIKGVKQ